jgi:nucleotidyltransferase/DNA polymerase involved in DNA repair
MALLAQVSPLVEQVSIDEAYPDLAAGRRSGRGDGSAPPNRVSRPGEKGRQ